MALFSATGTDAGAGACPAERFSVPLSGDGRLEVQAAAAAAAKASAGVEAGLVPSSSPEPSSCSPPPSPSLSAPLKIRARASAYALSLSDRSVPNVVDAVRVRSAFLLPPLPLVEPPSASQEDKAALPWVAGVQLRLRSVRFIIFIFREAKDGRGCCCWGAVLAVVVVAVAASEPAPPGEFKLSPPIAVCESAPISSPIAREDDGDDEEQKAGAPLSVGCTTDVVCCGPGGPAALLLLL